MNKPDKQSNIPMLKYIALWFTIWHVHLELIAWAARKMVPIREGFLGSVPWANFDGLHYLSIAERGYVQFEQAFFPVYPILIRRLGILLHDDFLLAGLLISNICFIGVLILTWKLVIKLFYRRKNRETIARQTIISLLFFPTSYYFGSVYTESLFLLCVLGAWYLLLEHRRILFGIVAGIASGIRLVGAFLSVPVGLIMYMHYLYQSTGDPLLFIHAQPAFGANRTGGDLIILPQVIWRYMKIYTTVPLYQYDYWIAVLEMAIFLFSLVVLWCAWKSKLPRNWIYFSLLSIVMPTLTGTLSSMPRYVLVAFPMFIVLGMMREPYRNQLLGVLYVLFIILTALFVTGHWVA